MLACLANSCYYITAAVDYGSMSYKTEGMVSLLCLTKSCACPEIGCDVTQGYLFQRSAVDASKRIVLYIRVYYSRTLDVAAGHTNHTKKCKERISALFEVQPSSYF